MEKNKIFISHRHSDTQSDSFALKTELQKYFGEDNVFLDFKNLIPGTKFAEYINNTLKESRVVLVIIGPDWQGPKNEEGVTRIFEKEDWVRREVAAALADPHSHVIPVLVKNAREPQAKDLPEDLKSLAELQTIEINIKRWEYDVSELVKVLEKFLPKKHNPKAQASPEPLPNPRAYIAPIPQQKSWLAKNYLYVLGGVVVFFMLIGLLNSSNDDYGAYQDPGSDTTAVESDTTASNPSQPLSDSGDPRRTNPNGTEIYDSLTLEETIPDFSGSWWLYEKDIRSGYFQINQSGSKFSFVYYLFDTKVGAGTGYFENNTLVTETFVLDESPGQYGFMFETQDGGQSWQGQTIANQEVSPAYLVKR